MGVEKKEEEAGFDPTSVYLNEHGRKEEKEGSKKQGIVEKEYMEAMYR